jgi:hypothetical protein
LPHDDDDDAAADSKPALPVENPNVENFFLVSGDPQSGQAGDDSLPLKKISKLRLQS